MALLTKRKPRDSHKAARWMAITISVTAIHVACFAVSISTQAASDFGSSAPLCLRIAADQIPLEISNEDEREPASFSQSEQSLNLSLPARGSSTGNAAAPSTLTPFSGNGNDATSVQSTDKTSRVLRIDFSDRPLDAGAPSSKTSEAHASGNGKDEDKVHVSDNGVSGFAAAPSGTGKNTFDRLVGAMGPVQRGEALRLPGKPAYPRACRLGLCRDGKPCEGQSEWKISVGAEGGNPTKIESIKKMDCELQNAAIRTFFSKVDFPKTEQPKIYIFPVRMFIENK
jgi:hypothetical protein